MPFIEWNNNFLTGIKECDVQHKKLVNMLNALHEAIRLNVEKKAIEEALYSLVKYFNEHFRLEEELMEKKGYQGIEEHREEHKNFKEKLNKMLQSYHEKGNVSLIEILKFFKNWWINHILIMDKKYGIFLKM